MMLRAVIAAALASAVILPATIATAGPIEDRQAIMKGNGRDTKLGGDMLKGATPFDAATAQKILANYAAAAKAFPAHFPAGSNKGETEAAPAIWSMPVDWKAATDKFQKDTTAAVAMKPATLADFGKAFGMVTANCKSCHESFRIKKG
ncbi:c-type cytochrome [Sandarakinorhabdus rubra]|uniref:c-type cytochrome n=1 Tax=Sandarakinorhabdus rubra TaxID=2672568 RepID=UPI0013DA8E88|nr:cytochrome c [Sandarakinorhabdus rubra]